MSRFVWRAFVFGAVHVLLFLIGTMQGGGRLRLPRGVAWGTPVSAHQRRVWSSSLSVASFRPAPLRRSCPEPQTHQFDEYLELLGISQTGEKTEAPVVILLDRNQGGIDFHIRVFQRSRYREMLKQEVVRPFLI